MKRTTVFLIIFFLLIPLSGLFAGGDVQGPGVAEKMTFTWLGAGNEEKVDDSWAEKIIQDKWNVEIKVVNIPQNDEERKNLLAASGDFPDVAYWGKPGHMGLYNDGLTRSIPKSYIEKYAPEYTKRMSSQFPHGWLFNRAPGSDDEYVSMTQWCVVCAPQPAYTTHFRYDWLQNVGLAPADAIDTNPDPTPVMNNKNEMVDPSDKYYMVKSHQTFDWLEKVLSAFKHNDPNQSGKDDTWPLLQYAPFYSNRGMMEIFGVSQGMNLVEDGKLIVGEISKGYKAYLKKMQEWYAAGYIDSEWALTKGRNEARDKFNQGLGGIFAMHCVYLTYFYKQYDPLFEKFPNGKVMVAAPIKGPEGTYGMTVKRLDVVDSGAVFVVNKKVDDKKLAKFLQIYDWINFDEEMQVKLRYGDPGVHFNWSGTPWASSPVLKEGIVGGGGDLGLAVYFHGFETTELAAIHQRPQLKIMEEQFMYGDHVWDWGVFPKLWDPLGDGAVGEVNSKFGSALNTIRDEYFANAMTGEVDIDATWDNYVKQWMSSGGEKLMAEHAKGLDYTEWRKGNIVRWP